MIFERILLAVDESAIAAHAADVGVKLARTLGADLAFAWVVDRSAAYFPDGGVPAAELMALAEQDAKRLLAGFLGRMAPKTRAFEFVTLGKPASEIVKTATQWPADLIVIGSHGRSGVSRMLEGSVAEEVMRHAPCAVLVVRGRE